MDWLYIVQKIVLGGLFLVIVLGLSFRFFRNFIGKEKSVKAKLLDKYSNTYNQLNQYCYYSTKVDYILVFDSNGVTFKFQVSPFVYDCVEKGQHGMLKYKGDHYIEFIRNNK